MADITTIEGTDLDLGKIIMTFEGDHSKNKPYEKFSLVDAFGGTFLSKKDVPINVDVTNLDYWECLSGKTADKVKTITVGGDASKYYPVYIHLTELVNSGMTPVTISRSVTDVAPRVWVENSKDPKGLTWDASKYDLNSDGYPLLDLTLFVEAGNRGNLHHEYKVINFKEYWANMVSNLVLSNDDGLIVYLRGGGAVYNIGTSIGAYLKVDVHLDKPRPYEKAATVYRKYQLLGEQLAEKGQLLKDIYLTIKSGNYLRPNDDIMVKDITSQDIKANSLITKEIGVGSKLMFHAYDSKTNKFTLGPVASVRLENKAIRIDGVPNAPSQDVPVDIFVNGKKIWHEGNDGDGSGLDADKLDGEDSTRYLKAISDINGKSLNDKSILAANGIFGIGNDVSDTPREGAVGSRLINVRTNNNRCTQMWYDVNGLTSIRHLTHDPVNFTISEDTGWSTIWSSQNQGSGTGLDADTVDTFHVDSNGIPHIKGFGSTGEEKGKCLVYKGHLDELQINSTYAANINTGGRPEKVDGVVVTRMHISTGGDGLQMYYSLHTNGIWWLRVLTNGVWSDWVENINVYNVLDKVEQPVKQWVSNEVNNLAKTVVERMNQEFDKYNEELAVRIENVINGMKLIAHDGNGVPIGLVGTLTGADGEEGGEHVGGTKEYIESNITDFDPIIINGEGNSFNSIWKITEDNSKASFTCTGLHDKVEAVYDLDFTVYLEKGFSDSKFGIRLPFDGIVTKTGLSIVGLNSTATIGTCALQFYVFRTILKSEVDTITYDWRWHGNKDLTETIDDSVNGGKYITNAGYKNINDLKIMSFLVYDSYDLSDFQESDPNYTSTDVNDYVYPVKIKGRITMVYDHCNLGTKF